MVGPQYGHEFLGVVGVEDVLQHRQSLLAVPCRVGVAAAILLFNQKEALS